MKLRKMKKLLTIPLIVFIIGTWINLETPQGNASPWSLEGCLEIKDQKDRDHCITNSYIFADAVFEDCNLIENKNTRQQCKGTSLNNVHKSLVALMNNTSMALTVILLLGLLFLVKRWKKRDEEQGKSTQGLIPIAFSLGYVLLARIAPEFLLYLNPYTSIFAIGLRSPDIILSYLTQFFPYQWLYSITVDVIWIGSFFALARLCKKLQWSNATLIILLIIMNGAIFAFTVLMLTLVLIGLSGG
ncbi:MAG: hypothetical protein Q8P95_01130 [bacterium]|nr:hypothetical protein [bacterium]